MRGLRAPTGDLLVGDLDRFGDRLAVVSPSGEQLSYRELARRVPAVAERLGPQQRLIMVTAATPVAVLVTYRAAGSGRTRGATRPGRRRPIGRPSAADLGPRRGACSHWR
ncbi:hypothetical protein GCM10027047_00290 [Rhodococcus aerolatus]